MPDRIPYVVLFVQEYIVVLSNEVVLEIMANLNGKLGQEFLLGEVENLEVDLIRVDEELLQLAAHLVNSISIVVEGNDQSMLLLLLENDVLGGDIQLQFFNEHFNHFPFAHFVAHHYFLIALLNIPHFIHLEHIYPDLLVLGLNVLREGGFELVTCGIRHNQNVSLPNVVQV